MGLFDFLGPLNFGGKGRSPWDLGTVQPDRKAYSWTLQDHGAALTVNTLVHGPGATDLLVGRRGNDANSAVFACLQAICSAYVEAPLTVYRQTNPKDREPQFDSPLQQLLDSPNPALDVLELLWWVQWAKHAEGNAYLRKIRSGHEEKGNVIELWPISPSRIEPRTTRDSGEFISYYRYYIRPGKHIDISPNNIIHFRMGIDDGDHRLGCSPLKRLIREVSSDDQATRYADRLLANLAINGLSMEFDKDALELDQAMANELKARIQAAYGGDNVGATAVLAPGAKLVSHGFSPEQMDLKVLHRVPEERISAVMRVPAIVAGLGAGLDRSTFANFGEAREAFIENTILSLYRSDDKKLTHSLAPDFTSDGKISIAHDISQMRALQDDEDKKATRLAAYVAAGILDVNEARAEIGREPRIVAAGAAPGVLPPATRSRPYIVSLPGFEGLKPGEKHESVAISADRIVGLPITSTQLANDHITAHKIADGVERKAADDIGPALARQRAAQEAAWIDEVTTFFDGQGARVSGRMRAGATFRSLVPASEEEALSAALTPLQRALLADVYDVVRAGLGVEFGLDDPLTRQYLKDAGTNIGGITTHTREAVRAALIEGQAAGEGISELARRLRDLPAFGQPRAEVVARTELGHAANTAAVANYRASGVVVGVRVHDGDSDQACAAMNGRTFPLDKAPASLQHPNCVRALAPLTDASQVEGAA